MSNADYNIHVTGAGRGSNVGTFNVAGVVHGGMGNRETTNYNQGSRRIVNTGQIGNIATGDNHAGGMQATIAGQQGAPARKENRQQTYHIESAQGVVGGQDMRGASVDQRGVTEGRSGHIGYFRGKDLSEVTEEDIVGLLRERKLAKHIPLFQEHGIDGDLLSQLTDVELIDFGFSESFERKKILNLKKCLPK